LQYIGSRGGETEGSNLSGSYQNTGLQYPVYDQVNQLRQTYRVFNTVNLQGEHQLDFLGKSKSAASPQLSYNLSSSKSTQDEPDFRFSDVADLHETHYVDQTGTGIGSDIYSYVVGSVHGIGTNGVIGADPNGRKYRNLTETNYNAKADLSETFTVKGLSQIVKFGANYLYRKRDFSENILGLPGTNDSLLNVVSGNVDKLVSYQYIGLQDASTYDNLGQPRVGGFLYQIKKSPNNYSGTYETRAFYGMVDLHFSEKLRVSGGVRFETTDIETNVDTTNVYNPLSTLTGVSGAVTTVTGSPITNPHIVYAQNYKPYYSVNLTYKPRPDMNVRLGYYTSLARPELREMTNIYEFDPFQFAVVVGNPKLINQLTRSEDVRWEWFPAPGEVISGSFFAKQIDNQLNKVFIYNSPGSASLYPEYPIVEYQNDPNRGYIYGIELEFRKSLGNLWRPLNHFFIGTNFMGAYSEITKNGARDSASRINDRHAPEKSPVYEQPPYSINVYLDYDNPKSGTNITASFNVVGERLIQIQLDGTPDIYDRPAPLLDVVFSQKLGKKFLLKGFAKNLLNPAFREVYAYPENGGKFYGSTYIHHQYYKGTDYAIGLSYNLF
jgi:TonB-dependent receptor